MSQRAVLLSEDEIDLLADFRASCAEHREIILAYAHVAAEHCHETHDQLNVVPMPVRA